MNTLPAGIIAIWPGTLSPTIPLLRVLLPIPKGWALCDGTQGTPDLTDRYIVCAGNNYAVGATGGELATTVGAHHHPGGTATCADDPHQHVIPDFQVGAYAASTVNVKAGTNSFGVDPNHYHTNFMPGLPQTEIGTPHTHDVTVADTGDYPEAVFDNRPAARVLAFIMKL
jgi:hypothetical protein